MRRSLVVASMSAMSAMFAILAGCGGGGGSAGSHTGGAPGSGGASSTGGATAAGGTTGNPGNTLAAVLDDGPQHDYFNGLFVTVTLCVPGTSTCQSIDHVLVDTGSTGLRVLESVLTLPLPPVTDASGNPTGVCAQFVDGTAWGPVLAADVKLNGEVAPAIPIQAVGENAYPMPGSGTCTSGPAITDLSSLRANGLMGLGTTREDCGTACAGTTRNPGMYFSCTSNRAGGCKPAVAPVNSQTRNPIASFPVDNNGVIIQLPSVPAGGLVSTTGMLIFGIGTQANNGLGSATVFTPVDAYDNIGTAFPVGGTKYTAFMDSGTNTLTFLDSATSGLALCKQSGLTDFYCPAAPTPLNITVFGGNNQSAAVIVSVADPTRTAANVAVLDSIATEMPGFPSTNSSVPDFLWGLPFFFGRSVYTALENVDTPGGRGPFVAF